MNPIDVVLRQLDDAWGHAWESVVAVLAGVGLDEAAWQPGAYGDEAVEDGWPQPGTLHWHVAHLAANKREYAGHVRRQTRPNEAPPADHRPAAAFTDELAALHNAHADLRAAIAALTTKDLGGEGNHSMPLPEYLAMVIRHDSWHAGQIAVVRRLYRHDQAGESS